MSLLTLTDARTPELIVHISAGTYGTYNNIGAGPGPALMGADTLIGNDIYNMSEESPRHDKGADD
jgi:hypothetical protein